MAASSCEPLVSICPYDPMFKVDVLLHNPLHEHVGVKHEHKMEAMALCLSLDTLIRQDTCKHTDHRQDKGRRSSSFHDKAGVVTNTMQQVINKSFNSLPCASFLQQSGLDHLFPKVASVVSGVRECSKSSGDSAISQYLNQMSSLNHALGVARQINQDVSHSTNLKYLAHQISVLYASCNPPAAGEAPAMVGTSSVDHASFYDPLQALSNIPSSGKTFSRHLKNIEENFQTLKASISDLSKSDFDQLPTEVRDWVLEITDSIIDTVTSLPPDLTQTMLPVASVLQHGL